MVQSDYTHLTLPVHHTCMRACVVRSGEVWMWTSGVQSVPTALALTRLFNACNARSIHTFCPIAFWHFQLPPFPSPHIDVKTCLTNHLTDLLHADWLESHPGIETTEARAIASSIYLYIRRWTHHAYCKITMR